MFCKQVFCETKQNSQESTCAGVPFKYSWRALACSVIKKQTPMQVFSCHNFTHVQVQWSSKVSYDLLIKTCERKLLQDIMRVPKRQFVCLQRNTKFYNCTQKTIRFFTAKCKILKLHPNGHFTVLQRNKKILKLHPNGHSFFYSEIQNSESCTQTAICIFHNKIRNLTITFVS